MSLNMGRITLGACVLLACSQGSLAAQADVMSLRERSGGYLGCYELRLFGWNAPAGADAAESIPDRVVLTPTTIALRYEGQDSSVLVFDFALGPFPGYGSSDFVDERWSLSSATDSVALTWGDAAAGVRAVLAMVRAAGGWRLSGRAAAWSEEAGVGAPAQPDTTALRGRAAGRSVDCDR
jgi:hypothetical protein